MRTTTNPAKLRAVHQTWVSLITTCKGVAFEILQGTELPGKASSRLVQHYRASGLKERCRLTVDFYTMKMELGEHPRKFLLRVDQMVKELERVERPVDPKDIDIVILSGLTSQCDAEVRMSESSSDWPTRRWIEGAVINQYERFQSEQSAAGSQVMLAGRGNGRNSKPSPPRCPLCSRTGHTAKGCREYVVTKRDHKPNGRQGDSGKNGGRDTDNAGGKYAQEASRSEGEKPTQGRVQANTRRVLLLRGAPKIGGLPSQTRICRRTGREPTKAWWVHRRRATKP